jgi:hypothetical protein
MLGRCWPLTSVDLTGLLLWASGEPQRTWTLAAHMWKELSAEYSTVRSASAVVSTNLFACQRHQPADRRLPRLANAVNRDKRPCSLVRIE